MKKNKNEFRILDNYSKNGMDSRWFLLRGSFQMIEKINNSQFNSENERLKLLCYIQLDIIFKIMEYTEDIAILSIGILNDSPFYNISNTLDYNVTGSNKIGHLNKNKHKFSKYSDLKIKGFYNNINRMSDDVICKMLSYIPKDQIQILNVKNKDLIEKIIRTNIDEIRRILEDIGRFRRANEFTNYKHIILSTIYNIGPFVDNLNRHQTCSMITLEKKGSKKDTYVIPFSNNILISYKLLIKDIETLLNELISNRISMLKRNVKGIIPNTVMKSSFTAQEKYFINESIRDFDLNYPHSTFDKFSFIIPQISKDFEWYSNIDSYLKYHEDKFKANN